MEPSFLQIRVRQFLYSVPSILRLPSRSNEHVAYQYKVVLSSEIEQLTASLASFDVVEPINPVSSDDSASVEQQQAIQYEQVQYERAVAQSIYMLPTVWPPNADYLVDLNHDKSRQLCPSTEVCLPTIKDAAY